MSARPVVVDIEGLLFILADASPLPRLPGEARRLP